MNRTPDNRDEVIEEIHRTRALIAAKFRGDIAAMVEDARQRQAASGRPIWRGRAIDKSSPPSSAPKQPS